MSVKRIALIGPTASGKSALAIKLAHTFNGVILSIDSLAVYKELDIASAKPTLEERDTVVHFGIDVLTIDTPFNVTKVTALYHEALNYAQTHKKVLIIVGGSSFYLKTLLTGLSHLPHYDAITHEKTQEALRNLPHAHALLARVDGDSAAHIAPTDRYRLEKMLLLYFQTHMPPSHYFAEHPPKPLIEPLDIFSLTLPKPQLHERIMLRTHSMIEAGVIDEVFQAERRYGRMPQAMKSIGVRETLDFLDAKLDKAALIEAIAHNTRQLAKRQITFNSTQFEQAIAVDQETLEHQIATYIKA